MINILFIAYGVLGDHIICFKSLQLLKEKYTDCNITFVGEPKFAEIGIKYAGNIINKVLPYKDFMEYTTQKDYKSVFWEDIFCNSNIIINHRMDDNNYFANSIIKKGFNWLRAKQSNIQINSSSKILVQSKIQNQNRNAYAQVSELVELLGCTTNCWQTKLSISQEQKNKIFNDVNNFFGTKTKNLIAFHPGSSSVEKNYDIEKWADIINKIIIKSNSRILIFIGPNEKKYLSAINLLFDRNKIMLIEKEIIESIAYLSICNLFLGHDTGFAHISASLIIPSILLFGKYSKKHWEPPISSTKVIRIDDLQKANHKEIKNKVLTLAQKA